MRVILASASPRRAELLRAAGLRLQTLSEVYGIPADENVADVEWLRLAGTRAWIVLMKDERNRYRAAERQALVGHEVRAFCLTSGNLRAHQMAEIYVSAMNAITDACMAPGPFLYAVSPRGLRRLDLDQRKGGAG